MPSLSEVYGDDSRKQGAEVLPGLSSWTRRLKEKRQKKALMAVGTLLREDNIPLDQFYDLMMDADLDPNTMFQNMEPMLKEKKRQQFSKAGPEWVAAIQRALAEDKEIPLGELSVIGGKYGLGMGDVLIGLKMLQETGLIPTIGQKIQEKGQRLETYKFGAKTGAPFASEEGAQQYEKDTGFKPYQVPGAQDQALAQGAAQGMAGPTIGAQQTKQKLIAGGTSQKTLSFPGGPPAQPKAPTSPTALFAQDPKRFRQMKQIEQEVKPPKTLGPKTYPEQRAERGEETDLESMILGINEEGIPNIEINPTLVQTKIDRFNAITKQPYRYIIIPAKEGSGIGPDFMYSDTLAKVEKVSVEEFNKRKRQKSGTEGSWRDYLK